MLRARRQKGMWLLFALLVSMCALFACPLVSWADVGGGDASEEGVLDSAADSATASADSVAKSTQRVEDTAEAESVSADVAQTAPATSAPTDTAVAEPKADAASPAQDAATCEEPAAIDAQPDVDAAAAEDDTGLAGRNADSSITQADESPSTGGNAQGGSETTSETAVEQDVEPQVVAETAPAAAAKQTAGAGAHQVASSAQKTPILAAGTYLFTWLKSAKYIVQSKKTSYKAGASVVLGKKNAILRQRWIVKFDEKTGYYTLVNEQTKKVLAVASKKNGANVVQAKAKAGKKSQLWMVVKKGSSYVFVPKANRKLALTGVKAKGGYNLVVRKMTKGKAQRFAMKDGGIVRNGVYKIALTRKASKVLQVAGASNAVGASVQRASYAALQNQKFRVTYRGNNQYTIAAVHSGKYVGANGANTVQAADGNAAAQRWIISWNKKGVAFKNAETGLRLNSAGSSAAVTGVKAANNKDQRWKLVKVSPAAVDPIVAKALVKAKKSGSYTKYFIAVDLKKHRTLILKRSGSTWKLSKNWICSTGKSSTPTPQGHYTVGIKGYSFGHGYTCYYYTQFWGDYLFHSVPYKEGTFSIRDGRLGKSVSAGCVRLSLSHAKWIYNHIPGGTHVVTYR